MKASDIANILKKLAPPELAYKGEEMDFIVGGESKEVRVVGVTERPTVEVLKEAVKEKVDMLVIHEPLYQKTKSFLVSPDNISALPNKQRKELVEKGGFCVYRYHSQWDDAVEGNNEVLANLLGLQVTDKIPYGRIGTAKGTDLQSFAFFVKKKLGCDSVLVVGEKDRVISKVAVVAGSGNSLIEMMELAKAKGADVLVSGDIKDSTARYAKELDLAVIDAGDYFTENPGAKRLTELLSKELKEIKTVCLDPGPPWDFI